MESHDILITRTLYWVIAPRDIPIIGVKQGDRLLVNIVTGELKRLERVYN